MAKQKNILTFHHGEDLNERTKERVLIYGRAGVGKTRFALSYPESWGRCAYYAADKNSWLLPSISRKKRGRVEVVKPEGPDPEAQFQQFCMMDLEEQFGEIGVLVVDTYTKIAMDSLSHIANTLQVTREPHAIIGDLEKGGVAIPTRSDFQGVDALSKQYLDDLFDLHADKHIIFLMHEESKMIGGANGTVVGGPQHPGWTMIDYLPSQFSTVIRLIRDEILVPGASDITPVVVAITEYDGKFPAKLRTCDEDEINPIGRVVLERNPNSWWVDYESYMQGLLKPAEQADALPVKKKKKKLVAVQPSNGE
jgi:hypothetical protein